MADAYEDEGELFWADFYRWTGEERVCPDKTRRESKEGYFWWGYADPDNPALLGWAVWRMLNPHGKDAAYKDVKHAEEALLSLFNDKVETLVAQARLGVNPR